MASFLIDEYNDKQQRDMAKEVSKWSRIIHTGIPHQQNYSDCGVFMVKYADNLVRGYLIQNLTLGHVFQHLLILPFPLLHATSWRTQNVPCFAYQTFMHNLRVYFIRECMWCGLGSLVWNYFVYRAGTPRSVFHRRTYQQSGVAWLLRCAPKARSIWPKHVLNVKASYICAIVNVV